MQITTNLIQKYIPGSKQPVDNAAAPAGANETKKINNLPSTDVNGISQVNTSLPVSYTKIGEISVPGLKKKASVYKLSNGQKVVIQPKKDGPTYVRTSFAVGALNEDDDKRGISHFIEHNLFNGSRNLATGEYDKKIAELGGDTNAYTTVNETQYYLSLELLNDNSLEEAIKLNANQTQFPTFPVEPMIREKEPVKSEIDKCSDDPANRAYTIMLKNMFNLETNSEDIVIGTKDNINRLTREDLFDYYNTWYTPDNAVTVITGDVDEKETIELVSKYYNKQNDYSNISKRKYPVLTPSNKPSRVDIKQKNNPNSVAQLGFPLPAGISKEDEYKLSILFSLISSANSDISQRLDKFGASIIIGVNNVSSDPGAAKFIATQFEAPEEQTEEILKIIYEEFTNLANNPPRQEDLQRIIDSTVYSLHTNEYSEEISEQLIDIVKNNDLNYFQNAENTIKSITPQEISDLAKKYLDLSKISICVAHPESSSNEEIINNYKNANAAPANVSFGKSAGINDRLNEYASSIEQYNLNNNVRAALIPTEGTPETHIELDLTSDINKNISMAEINVLNTMLSRGNAFMDNVAFSKTERELKAGIGIAADQNHIVVSASSPAENTQKTVDLIKQTLLNPNFTQEEFDRAKELVKKNIRNSTISAYDKLCETIYPDNKYYANNEYQLQALEKLTLDDVKKLYYGILNNSQAQLSAAIPKDNIENIKTPMLSQFDTGLPNFRTFVPAKNSDDRVYKPNTGERYITAAQENAQADIVQSYSYKYTGNINDKAKINVLNIILGGGMSSRLFEDLRNNEKIAYHVASHSGQNGDCGLINLEIQTSTDSDEASSENVTKALNAFKRNVEKLKKDNITQEELDSAKTCIKTAVLSGLEGSYSKNNEVKSSIDSKYGLNYNAEFIKAIDEVTADDIKAAANYVFQNPPVNAIVASKKTLDELNLK